MIGSLYYSNIEQYTASSESYSVQLRFRPSSLLTMDESQSQVTKCHSKLWVRAKSMKG